MDNDIKRSSRIFTEMIGKKRMKWSSVRCKTFRSCQLYSLFKNF